MKAAIYREYRGPISIESLPDPAPAPDGVVLRVEANGVCRSDWHGWVGHDPDIVLPHVPGHEIAGVVEEVGREVTRWRPGDRASVPFIAGCGRCVHCRAGDQQVCGRQFQPGFHGWGGFAERVALRHADLTLVALPDDVEFVTAASLGCRFATAFRAVQAQGRVSGGRVGGGARLRRGRVGGGDDRDGAGRPRGRGGHTPGSAGNGREGGRGESGGRVPVPGRGGRGEGADRRRRPHVAGCAGPPQHLLQLRRLPAEAGTPRPGRAS